MLSRALLTVFPLLALVSCSDPSPATPSRPAVFGLGVATRIFVDSSRRTPANGTQAALAERTLATEIWYPTAGAAGLEAAREAAVDRAHGPYPLVLFVHGSSGGRSQSTFLTRALATSGYVVASADFPLTSLSTAGGPSDLHVGDQLDDLRFLVDQVTALSDDAAAPFAGSIRRDQVAVVGHSTGGTVALLAAYAPDRHDARVRGVVALAPCACFFGTSFFTTRSLPLLVVAGSNDLFVPPANNGARAYRLAPAPKAYASLVGGTHLYFTDFGVPDSALSPVPTTSHDDISVALSAYGGGTDCEPSPPNGADEPLTAAEQHAHTITIVRAFLDDLFGATHGALPALAAATDPQVRWQRQ
jgi:predicted dienelactone hydrolase